MSHGPFNLGFYVQNEQRVKYPFCGEDNLDYLRIGWVLNELLTQTTQNNKNI